MMIYQLDFFGFQCYFLNIINEMTRFDEDDDFYIPLILKPFKIYIFVEKEYYTILPPLHKLKVQKTIFNDNKSFKIEKCVVCLEEEPKVLFCNCGHTAICVECSKIEQFDRCPSCNIENNILRIIE